MSSILTFYSDQHEHHAPTYEILHGRHVPYFEKPERLQNIRQALTSAGLVDIHTPEIILTMDEISKTHDPKMVDYLHNLSTNVRDILKTEFSIYQIETTGDEYYYESMFPKRHLSADQDPRTYFIYDNTSPVGHDTWSAVHHSANLAYAGAQALLKGEKLAYAVCRPPGHHAGYDFMGGYCYVNNAAIAANTLKVLGKVAIIDIDYHHGNGTQDIFWNDPNIIFGSIHADPAVDYPYYAGYASETGGNRGHILNYPLPHGADEALYLSTLDTLLDKVKAFNPATVVISLGFDTFKLDPMGKFKLEIASYQKIASRIQALSLPTLYIQEGGYYIAGLGEMAVSFFRGVLAKEA